MRPVSSLAVKRMSVFSILLAVLLIANVAPAQSGKAAKKKLSSQALHAQPAAGATAQASKGSIPPPVTTDTWTGSGGTSSWSNTSNWNNGAPNGDNVVIGLTTAATVVDDGASIGTLTLSHVGDSVSIANNNTLTVSGNISNAGSITLDSTGNNTVLDLAGALTLSGAGSIVLNNGGGPNYITGASGTVFTNSSTISGGASGGNANVGEGNLVFANSGTINANANGLNLYLEAGGASTNTGTIEATNGGTLFLYGQSWTQTGAGTISAANGSSVILQNNASVTGGVLSTSGTGIIAGGSSQNVSLSNLTNAGTYDVQNNNTTFISGTITNNGTINLLSTGNNTNLDLTANTTLAGTGTVVLGNGGGPNYINGVSGAVLTNNSTITGGAAAANANVGEGLLGLVNNGTINANVSGTNLYVDPLSTATDVNTKTLEATNGGTLVLYGGSWTNTGGTISAASGSSVDLANSVSITGGTLTSSGTGVIYNQSSSYASLTGVTLSTGTTYDVQNNAQTNISGTITNNGTINLQSTNNNTELYIPSSGSNSATLAGTGTVVMGTGSTGINNLINGASGATLTNQETITGVGNIGEGNLNLVNSGTINANISPTVSTLPLYIQAGTGGLTNTGTLEATNGGTLVLLGGAINNAGGIIKAVGSDSSNNPSSVDLTNTVSITGGTLSTSGAGIIYNQSGTYAGLTNLTLNATYDIQNNAQTNLSGTITNNGTITLLSSGNNTELYTSTNTTLAGTGTVIMGGTSLASNIVGGAAGTTLTNSETIEGGGQIGNGITIVNKGIINANANGGSLVLQPAAASINSKTLEATNGGQLIFNGGTWTNTGATISAGNGSAVDLANSVSITGGTLSSSGSGYIYNQTGTYANLANLTIAGTYEIANNAQTDISGTITNNGQIQINGTGNNTELYTETSTTLKGTGTVVMGGSVTANDIIGGASGTTLSNGETIEGAGQIGNGNAVANSGTINANVSGANLILQPAAASTNSHVLEATAGGQLVFNGGAWTQTSTGTITAGTGSSVDLANGASITGGTLNTSGTGVIYNQNGTFAYLTNLTNSGTYQVQNNAETVLAGTITNNGQIQLNSTGNNTALEVNGTVTLAGTGTVVLGNGGPNFITGTGATPMLISSNTIEGTGNIGSSAMGFTNNGTLDSNVGGTLAINVNGSGFTNYNGATTTFTGGTYIANTGNITFAAGNSTGITTLAAKVTEEAGGQLINTTTGGNALVNLTSITSAGALTTNINFTDAGAFSNAGSLTILSGTTFSVGSLSQISGSTLTGGTYVLDSNLVLSGTAQNITINDANVTLAGGSFHNAANNTNAMRNLASNAGSLTLSNHTSFSTVGNFDNSGSLTINGGSLLTVNGTLAQISGTTLTGGTFVLSGNLDLATGTASITTNDATVTLAGGTIFNSSNSTSALAALSRNSKSLTLANNATFTTAGNFTNTGTLAVNAGSTFAINGNLTNYSTVSKTLTGGAYTVAGTISAAGLDIVTDSSNIVLDGTGKFVNSTNSANGLANLSSISSTGSFGLGQDANFTTIGNFTNSGKLSINAGSTFSVAGTLSNLSAGTLSGGNYTVAGTLQLTAANGGITTNSATLTLSGKSAAILDGTANALAGFNNNTGTLGLTSAAALTTAPGAFTNSGTVTIAKGSTLTAGSSTGNYNQSAGTTTVDGTLATGTISATGGTIQGGGTLKANVSIGGGSSAILNVGDAGKAGLLAITGTYTQLSGGALNVSIGGTSAGTSYSQLKVTGTASLGGTLTAAVVNSFTPTVGQTFTVLTAHSITGTFSNSTIAINSTEHFVVSYTSTSVVLTVASGPASNSTGSTPLTSQVALTTRKPITVTARVTPPSSNLRRPISTGVSKQPVLLSTAIHNERVKTGGGWQSTIATAPWGHVKQIAVNEIPRSVNLGSPRSTLARPINNNWGTQFHAAPIRTPLNSRLGAPNTQRVPVHILKPLLPRVR